LALGLVSRPRFTMLTRFRPHVYRRRHFHRIRQLCPSSWGALPRQTDILCTVLPRNYSRRNRAQTCVNTRTPRCSSSGVSTRTFVLEQQKKKITFVLVKHVNLAARVPETRIPQTRVQRSLRQTRGQQCPPHQTAMYIYTHARTHTRTHKHIHTHTYMYMYLYYAYILIYIY
jgi:hypothetical protein